MDNRVDMWKLLGLLLGLAMLGLVLGGCTQLAVFLGLDSAGSSGAEVEKADGFTGFVPRDDLPEGLEMPGKVGAAVSGIHTPAGVVELELPPDGGTLDPHAIIGEDNRERITSTTSYPWSAVVSLIMKFPGSSDLYIGTGFFIGPRTVITSGHCVYDHDLGGWAEWVEVIPGRDGGSAPFGTHYAVNLKTTVGWYYYASPSWDIGAVILGSDVGNSTGWFGFAYYGRNKSIGQIVNTAGYPGDKPAGTQWFHYATIVRVKRTNKMFHNTDTYGGQSGSPLWRLIDGSRYVVGIHRGARGAYWNQAVWVTSAVFDLMYDWMYNP